MIRPGPIVSPVLLLALLALLMAPLAAQQNAQQPVAPAAPPQESAATEPAALSRSFRGLSLGMSLEELQAALTADDAFAFQGEADVSLLPSSDQILVESAGRGFIRRAFFQLRDGKVFIMVFALDSARVDHYSVFMTLSGKYGEPESLDPARAVWNSADTRVLLERPLTVKYLDLTVFTELLDESLVRQSREAELRQEFLNGL